MCARLQSDGLQWRQLGAQYGSLVWRWDVSERPLSCCHVSTPLTASVRAPTQPHMVNSEDGDGQPQKAAHVRAAERLEKEFTPFTRDGEEATPLKRTTLNTAGLNVPSIRPQLSTESPMRRLMRSPHGSRGKLILELAADGTAWSLSAGLSRLLGISRGRHHLMVGRNMLDADESLVKTDDLPKFEAEFMRLKQNHDETASYNSDDYSDSESEYGLSPLPEDGQAFETESTKQRTWGDKARAVSFSDAGGTDSESQQERERRRSHDEDDVRARAERRERRRSREQEKDGSKPGSRRGSREMEEERELNEDRRGSRELDEKGRSRRSSREMGEPSKRRRSRETWPAGGLEKGRPVGGPNGLQPNPASSRPLGEKPLVGKIRPFRLSAQSDGGSIASSDVETLSSDVRSVVSESVSDAKSAVSTSVSDVKSISSGGDHSPVRLRKTGSRDYDHRRDSRDMTPRLMRRGSGGSDASSSYTNQRSSPTRRSRRAPEPLVVRMKTLSGRTLWLQCSMELSLFEPTELGGSLVQCTLVDITVAETNKEIVRRRYELSYNSKASDEELKRLLSPKMVFNQMPTSSAKDMVADREEGGDTGREMYLERRQLFLRAFPDMKYKILEQNCKSDEQVFTSWQWTGTHTGPYASWQGSQIYSDIPPTGKVVHIHGVAIDMVQGGLITDHAAYYDEAALRAQLEPEGFNPVTPKRSMGRAAAGVQLQLLVVDSESALGRRVGWGMGRDEGGTAVRAIVRTARLGSERPSEQEAAVVAHMEAHYARKVLRILPMLAGESLLLCDGRSDDLPVLVSTVAFMRALGTDKSTVLRTGLISLLEECTANTEPAVATRVQAAVRAKVPAPTLEIFAAERESGEMTAFVLSLAPFTSGGEPYWIALLMDLSTEAVEDVPDHLLEPPAGQNADLAARYVHKLAPSWRWFECKRLESVLGDGIHALELSVSLSDTQARQPPKCCTPDRLCARFSNP